MSLFLFLLSFSSFGLFVNAEQSGSSPESGHTSKIKTVYLDLETKGFGTNSAGAWGDWGAMWNRIYSASLWKPAGTASTSQAKSGKTFFNTARTLQSGQAAAVPTPAPQVTPSLTQSKLNSIYVDLYSKSYGVNSIGTWGNFGDKFNRLYSSSIWTPTGTTATSVDVASGYTFYAGNSRTALVGTSLLNGVACAVNADCFTGTCTTFYQDSDADTYGNPNVSIKRCGTTYAGYVTNNTDCGPVDANAKPGSTFCSAASFANTSSVASYDWNCSNSSTACGTAYQVVAAAVTPDKGCVYRASTQKYGCNTATSTTYTFSGSTACGGVGSVCSLSQGKRNTCAPDSCGSCCMTYVTRCTSYTTGAQACN